MDIQSFRAELRKLWNDKVLCDRMFSLTGDVKYMEMKRQITNKALELIPQLPFFEILCPYDPFVNAYFIFDFILRILATLPIDRAHQFTRRKWQQYCGFGANWREKRNYSRQAKRAVILYLVVSAFPRNQPAKTVWGEIMRNELKRLVKKYKKQRDYRHCIRLAILNTGRKLVTKIWQVARELNSSGKTELEGVTPTTSYGGIQPS